MNSAGIKYRHNNYNCYTFFDLKIKHSICLEQILSKKNIQAQKGNFQNKTFKQILSNDGKCISCFHVKCEGGFEEDMKL
jgi:hypothetical protein